MLLLICCILSIGMFPLDHPYFVLNDILTYIVFFLVSDYQRAFDHIHEIEQNERTQCKYPVPKVIRISDINPSPNKVYYPGCTIVYQCRKDSGCCNDTTECGPKVNMSITLAFFVSIFFFLC